MTTATHPFPVPPVPAPAVSGPAHELGLAIQRGDDRAAAWYAHELRDALAADPAVDEWYQKAYEVLIEIALDPHGDVADGVPGARERPKPASES